LPLYIFAGDQLLGARLRPANIDAASGALDEVRCIVAQLRAKWPTVRIVLRGDSGFCREELMAWCEAEENHVDFLFGLARNSRLEKIIASRCTRPNCCTPRPARQRVCSPSSSTRPRRAGPASGA